MSEQKVNLGAVDLNQPQPGEETYVPPVDLVPLPSEGKVYGPTSPLAGAQTIEIRSMTARDEDILTSKGLLKSGKAIDTLLKSCILNKAIDVENMLVGDRNAVMVAIRVTGYGPEYKVDVVCPACGDKVVHEFDLGKLSCKPLGAAPTSPGVNEFEFKLPVTKKRVTFKLATAADEKEISTTLERAAKFSDLESNVTTRLQLLITGVEGIKEASKVGQFLKTLPARDSKELRKYMDKISPGVEMNQEFECPKCTEVSEVDVPMGTEFFWPSN